MVGVIQNAARMTETQAALKTIIEETVPGLAVEPAQDGQRTFKELGIDSLDKMSILLAVQEKWGKEFTETEINAMNSLDDICQNLG